MKISNPGIGKERERERYLKSLCLQKNVQSRFSRSHEYPGQKV
jgi:hypothetical protein